MFNRRSEDPVLEINLTVWSVKNSIKKEDRDSLHPTLRTWLRLATMVIGGVVLLIVLQVGNNAVFDHRFPAVKIVNVPAGLGPR